MNPYAISGFINAITVIALGVFVYLKGREKAINRKYLIFCAFAGFWSYGYFLWQIAQDSSTALFYSRCLMAGSIFIPITFLDFTLVLLNQRQDKKRILNYGYALFFLFFLINFTPMFVKGVSPKLSFEYWPEPGIAYAPFLTLWFFYSFYACYLLFKGYRKTRGLKRNQIKYVLISISIGYIGGSTNYLLWYDIPVLPVGNFIVPVFVVIVAYAIVKHRLLNINIIIKKTIIYSLLAGTIAVVNVGFILLFEHIFKQTIGYTTFTATLFVALLIAIFFQPLYKWISAVVDKIFFKGTLPKLAEELQRSERLAALGVMASGLAHEIKNPLVPIKTYIQNLPNNVQNPEFLAKITTAIPREVDKITNLLAQLRDFAQPPPLNFTEVDLHKLLDARISLLTEELKLKNIVLEKHYSSYPIKINADPVQLERVFLNLFLNAIDAMPQGGKLTVTTEIGSDNMVLVKVSDTGIGIAKEDISHIFDPFFSKGKHQSSGLGLAIAYRIVKEHGGSISVESQLEKGTIFSVYLPVKEEI